MPYIPQERRERLERFNVMPPDSGADLCYVISNLVASYTEYRGLNYGIITEVRGALAGTLDEYNRLVAHPYEDKKRDENGDIWGILT